MVKHILFMSFYQWIIVFVLTFAGEYFLPEDQDYTPRNGKYIQSGRLYDWDGSDLYKKFRDSSNDPGPSRHMTIVFTTFVYMQVFNMLNARKINDELNIFSGICENKMFVIIWIIILFMQVFITQLTQDVFVVARDGLAWHQWLICIGIGLTVLPLDFIIKFIPDKVCWDLSKKKRPDYESVEENHAPPLKKLDEPKGKNAPTKVDHHKNDNSEITPNADKSSEEDRPIDKEESI